MRLRLLVIGAVVVLVAAMLWAQSEAGVPVTTFSSRTELVLVPVVVHDKDGKHLSGLTADQFELLDNNKARAVKVFEEVRANTTDKAAVRSDHEFGNYVLDQKSARRVTIIVLDVLNTPRLEQPRSRDAVIDYLKQHSSNSEPTSLLILSRNGLRQVHSFATNMEVLAKAVQQMKGEGSVRDVGDFSASIGGQGGGLFSEVKALGEIVDDKVNLGYESLKQRESINLTTQAFEAIARSYAGVPGRKALIWVTAGFELPLSRAPISSTTMLSYENFEYEDRGPLEQAWKALAAANVSVYPIDVIGMANNPVIKSTSLGVEMGQYEPNGPKDFDPRKYHQDTYREFALETGGNECINQNDISRCMRNAVDDSENYYLLGFYLPKEDRKTGLHKLAVKVNVPKVDLRYRKNYDTSGKPAVVEKKKERVLQTVYSSPLDYTDLELDVKIGTVVDSGMMMRKLPVTLSLPPSSVFVDVDHNNHSEVEFTAAAFDEKDKAVATISQTVHGDLKQQSAERLFKDGLEHTMKLDLPPGRYQLKCVVWDKVTGKVGSVTAPIEVK